MFGTFIVNLEKVAMIGCAFFEDGNLVSWEIYALSFIFFFFIFIDIRIFLFYFIIIFLKTNSFPHFHS